MLTDEEVAAQAWRIVALVAQCDGDLRDVDMTISPATLAALLDEVEMHRGTERGGAAVSKVRKGHRGRPPLSDDTLRDVARVYREAVEADQPANTADLEIEAASFQHMEDAAHHDDGETCNNPDCEDCEHPVTDWDRAQPLIDDRLGK